ncbi:hypothetical protein [uncultured Legionella sp.]|uniref:hypothetical protein n=1 Tax=uncultured Legionella sp. TaxID=210934 RepID=UPI0026271AE6|nr:hypothetical protein [uncultured Legionella sp.]
MDKKTDQISVIIEDEEELEITITQLIAESVARSDISVQGTPKQMKEKYGVSFIAPEVVQESRDPPVKEPFLNDDFGWIVGLSFAVPLFSCLIIAIFIMGDIRSSSDIWFYGICGTIVGSILGLLLAKVVKMKHDERISKQEKKGGFVLWVTVHSAEQHQEVINILKRHHPQHMKE